MTVEDVLKRRMKELLLKETPYVLEEARFGMFDLAVYVPEDCAFDGLSETLPVAPSGRATATCSTAPVPIVKRHFYRTTSPSTTYSACSPAFVTGRRANWSWNGTSTPCWPTGKR